DLQPKDWGVFTSWGRLLASSGLAAVTFNHRLAFPKTLVTEGAADVAQAIAYVRANADKLNIDKDRLCIAVFSAGGPMLANTLRERPAHIRCAVAFYPLLDIRQSPPHQASETPATLAQYSPAAQLTGDLSVLPPLFVARAGRDRVPGLNAALDRFVQAALAGNAQVTVANHAGGVHGFDNQNDDARSREIVTMAVWFLQTNLGMGER
ncbi:MAG TPA: alpha/beta hydrolase, partial [Rubrivivax sp.]|nr:alpha/beta hydrolase [Rubrivivax sp.]